MVLNRRDWLTKMGYSIAAALHCLGPWAELIPAAAETLSDEEWLRVTHP